MVDTPQALLQLVQSLSHVITYTDSSNIDTNRKLWDNYARDWTDMFWVVCVWLRQSTEADWVVKMVKNLPDVSNETNATQYLEHLGEEWSDKSSFTQVLEEYFWPYLNSRSVVGEVGSGGGRVASRVVSRVKQLYCFDISKEMLKKAQSSVETALIKNKDSSSNEMERVESEPFHPVDEPQFVLLGDPSLPVELDDHFDFIYAFDVFPHVDLHTQWRYYQEFFRVMKPGAKALIHTANMAAPLGWSRFAQQDKYSVGGFYFMVPEMVLTLIKQAGFEVITHSKPDISQDPPQFHNMYYNRDFIVIVTKPLSDTT